MDAFLLEKLRAKYPDSNFLTEETAPDDFSTLAGAPNLWIIDPLDGTGNFSRSDPNFAISIGLLNKGTIHIGVVHKPMTSEIFHAQIDQDGAYLNGNLIQVSPTDSLAKSAIAVDWPHDLEKRSKTVGFIEKLNKHVRQVKIMGSAVSDLMKVATGSIDAYLQPGLKPWDVAAAGIIVEKAGGKITNPDGSIWNPFSGAIFASNGKLQNQILQLTRQY